MARKLARGLVAAALLYGAALGLYALFGYEGERPGVDRVAADLHASVGDLLRTRRRAPVRPPPPTLEDEPPAGAAAPAEPSPAEEPPAAPPSGASAESLALERIAKVVIPQAEERARRLRGMERGRGFEEARGEALAFLGPARDLLGEILDRDPEHARANALYARVLGIWNALRKL